MKQSILKQDIRNPLYLKAQAKWQTISVKERITIMNKIQSTNPRKSLNGRYRAIMKHLMQEINSNKEVTQ